MNLETLKKYIRMGREIEFSYHGEMYSITYAYEGNRQIINFCQFSCPSIDYSSFDEFLNSAVVGDEYLRDALDLMEDVIVY